MIENWNQLLGTLRTWNTLLSHLSIENPEQVDERRKQMGLSSLEEVTKRHRENAIKMNEKPPENIIEYRKK